MNKVTKILGIVLIMALVFCTCALCLVGCNSNEGLIVKPNEDPEQLVESGFEIEYEDTPELGLSVQEIDPEDYEDYGISMAAESAYTITATVLPVDCTNKKVKWSVNFKDPSSTWASGKSASDYVLLSSFESDSGSSITVSCVDEFGEKIIITATSVITPSVTASCTCDYLQKLKNLFFNVDGSDDSELGYGGVKTMHLTNDVNTYRFSPVSVRSEACTITKDYLSEISWSLSSNASGLLGDARNYITRSLTKYNCTMVTTAPLHSDFTVDLSLDFICEDLYGKYFTNPKLALGSSVDEDDVKANIRYAVIQGLNYMIEHYDNPWLFEVNLNTPGTSVTYFNCVVLRSMDVTIPALSASLSETSLMF